MKRKQAIYYELAAPVYTRGSGFLIMKGCLLRQTRSAGPICRLSLQPIQDCAVKSVTICISLFDHDDHAVGEQVFFTYESPALKRDDTFGDTQEISVSEQSAASFSVYISSVVGINGETSQFEQSDAVSLTERIKLEDALSDRDLIDQFQVRYGPDCRYVRSKQEDLWFCVCGGINFRSEQSCHSCHRAKKALTDLNMESLRTEAESRLRAEAAASLADDIPKKKRFPYKAVALLLPLVLLVTLLVATIPGALRRERIYQNAVSALHAGNLRRAEELLGSLPSYRNSDDLLNYEIPYQRALLLLKDAEIERVSTDSIDPSFLFSEDAVIPRSIVLYQTAADAFSQLSGYQDCEERIEYCNSAIDEIILEQKWEVYNEASDLLENLHYVEAKTIFLSLSDYSDSEAMALESSYRKAVSLFRFLQIYDVSRIYAYFSDELSEPSILSLSSEEALRLGSGCITELRSACGEDPTDIRLEDRPSEQLVPFKDALLELFASLGDYKDSAGYPDKIEEETDYTREFFMLCSTGDLHAASRWLQNYPGDFPERNTWKSYLDLYLPYCADWTLYLGDSKLIPFSVGQNFSCTDVSSRVLLDGKTAVLRLSFGEGHSLTYDLPSELGETLFINTDSGQYGFMAAITNSDHFAYMCYSEGKLISSCEYELPE